MFTISRGIVIIWVINHTLDKVDNIIYNIRGKTTNEIEKLVQTRKTKWYIMSP